MTNSEIRRIIRKLSKRRHHATVYLASLLEFPHTNKDKINEAREHGNKLSAEINELMRRL
jgi:hypothetical protein